MCVQHLKICCDCNFYQFKTVFNRKPLSVYYSGGSFPRLLMGFERSSTYKYDQIMLLVIFPWDKLDHKTMILCRRDAMGEWKRILYL